MKIILDKLFSFIFQTMVLCRTLNWSLKLSGSGRSRENVIQWLQTGWDHPVCSFEIVFMWISRRTLGQEKGRARRCSLWSVCVYPTAHPRREPAIGAHCSVPPFLLHGFIPASVSLLHSLCFPSSQRCGWHHRACLATSACVCPHWGQRARSAGRIYRSHQEHLQHDQLCILQHFVLWCCGSSCPGNCERTW